MNFDPKMSSNEHVKRAKDGLDVWDDIFRYSKTGFKSIAEENFARMRWYGIYQQKPNEGHFMWRIKLPAGRLTPLQLRIIGELSAKYGRGFGDITTRQDIQLHWLTIEDFPDAFDRIYKEAGLYTDFACGDTPRNVTGCPLDGLIKDQIVPIGNLAQRLSDMFRAAGKELSNLPRKFKPSISACPLHCHQPQINDIGAFGVKRVRGGREERGLGIVVGGGLSSTPHHAQGLRVFIPEADIQRIVPEVFKQIALLFRDSDELRYKRKHARLKFLVAEKGWQWIRDELEKRLGYALEHDDAIVNPKGALHTDHVGIGEQNNGLWFVGAAVPRGRLSADQMLAAARLADRFAAADRAQIRLSQKQNLLLVNIPKENVEALRRELAQIDLPTDAPPWRQSLVSCTGTQFCNLAVVETKDRARQILEYLEREVQTDTPIMVSVSGCPNACAQYQIADIGLTGIPSIFQGKKQDGFNLHVGGCLGENPEFGAELVEKVPAVVVHKVIAAIVRGYMANRLETEDGDTEPFRDFVRRVTPEQLKQMAKIQEWQPAPPKQPRAAAAQR